MTATDASAVRSFTSPQHDGRNAAVLGAALGITFTVCFATGLFSHLAQHPPGWFELPARPAGLYRVTQALHVTTGVASIPLLLAKLWTVYPHFVARPAARSVGHAIERLALLPLVGGSLFLLMSGTANVARWYPWTFNFPRAHFWAAWITIGGLVVHIGAKAGTSRDALRRAPRDPSLVVSTAASRRGFLGGVAGAAALIVVATAGGTISLLSPVSALAQRRRGDGPQGLPVNKSAEGAGVTDLIAAASYRLRIEGAVPSALVLGLADLQALPQREAELPIACVEGWSASAHWRGVPIRDLLDLAGAAPDAEVHVESIQPGGSYRTSEINRSQTSDRDTLLALELNGEPLHPDHGFPARLIGPNRPGVLQTKWVERLVVL